MKNLDKNNVIGVTALLVHAAKIDEIYSEHEKDLIKNFIKSYLKEIDLNEILKKQPPAGVHRAPRRPWKCQNGKILETAPR